MTRATQGPRMIDVARLAGVSHQTVSRVLNGHSNVTTSTKLRVRAAIAELGYRPNRAARTLATGKSQVIGVVAQSSTLFGPASILAAFAQAAFAAGFIMSVVSVRTLQRDPMREAISQHLDQRVAGLVVITPVDSASDVLDEIPDDIPLVCIDGDPLRHTELVTIDQEAGGYVGTRHLLEAGHRTVWHVSGPEDWFDSRARIAGWRRALAEAGAEVPPLLPGDWSAASGYRAGQMLARMNEITAIFAANDHLALGILRALHEHGRHVPRDISVVGFDDVPEAEFYIPPLTTIRPDFDAIAAACLDLLLTQINSGTRQGSHRLIAPTLVSRDSVARPHGECQNPRAATPVRRSEARRN